MGRQSPLDNHLQTLLDWNAQGIERHEMARRLGVSKCMVQAYLQRRGVAPVLAGPGGSLDTEHLRRLIEVERRTQDETASILGCHPATVERAIARLGLKTARTGPRSGQEHRQQWAGGRCVDKHGYILVFVPLHPQAPSTAYVREHRLVCEVVLRRYLLPKEVVDHEDNHPRHNWPRNLLVYPSNADHLRATLTGRVKATPRSSIPGAYGNSQRIDQCPEPRETLAGCTEETMAGYLYFVESHRPTSAHAHLSRRDLLRSGPYRDPWQHKSTD